MCLWDTLVTPANSLVQGKILHLISLFSSVFGMVNHMLQWIFSSYSSFLQQSKDMHIRLIGLSKLAVLVNVSMSDCVSVLAL